jgi:tetratricopeptide (TPR) repeat protein
MIFLEWKKFFGMNRQQRRAAKADKGSSNSPAKLFDAGLRHLLSGQLTEAEKCCHQILVANPDHADSLHLLGLIAIQAKNYDRAVEQITLAISHNPKSPDYFSNLGSVLQRQGRFEEAVKSYNLALSLKPTFAEAWHNLGNVLQKLKRYDEARSSYDQALKINPRYLEALNKAGLLLMELESFEGALEYFSRSDQVMPREANTLYMMGYCLQRLLRFNEALACYNLVLELAPDNADTHHNLGIVYQELGQHDEALARFEKALHIKPLFIEALRSRANSLAELRRFDEAFSDLDKSISFKPNYADAYFNAALLRLLTGDFAAGWAGREWRWKCPALRLDDRQFSQPVWLGDQQIDGKTILLHSDEGLGDAIQFARYVPMVAELGALVLLEVQEELQPLMAELSGVSQCMPKSTGKLPDFDFHCPLSSLPLAFETQIGTVPSAERYLPVPEDVRRQAWEKRLGSRNRLRIGLVWSGNPHHKNDRRRSMNLSSLAPILELDATFVSLQKNIRAEDKSSLLEHSGISNVAEHLQDFTDTAALISCLDLVISVDTSVAHLAGALGCPVWILLPYTPDWRWLLDRHDSPWYESARLFRQGQTREWSSVLDRVGKALQELIGSRHHQEAVGTPAIELT